MPKKRKIKIVQKGAKPKRVSTRAAPEPAGRKIAAKPKGTVMRGEVPEGAKKPLAPKHEAQIMKDADALDLFRQKMGTFQQQLLRGGGIGLPEGPAARAIEKEFGEPVTKIERTPSGIFGLDELIEGGIEKGASVLVVGSAGTGKTVFGLQFLYYGAKDFKEPGIFISFEERKDAIYRHTNSFGWDFEELEKKGLFKFLEYKPHQVSKLMEEGGGTIKDAIRAMGAKRLVIDSITSYGLLFKDEYQRRETLLELFELLRRWGCTSILISELPPKVAEVKEGAVGFLTDAIISLYYSKKEEEAVRVHSIEVLKMRGTSHSNKICALAFEEKGIKVYPDVEVF